MVSAIRAVFLFHIIQTQVSNPHNIIMVFDKTGHFFKPPDGRSGVRVAQSVKCATSRQDIMCSITDLSDRPATNAGLMSGSDKRHGLPSLSLSESTHKLADISHGSHPSAIQIHPFILSPPHQHAGGNS